MTNLSMFPVWQQLLTNITANDTITTLTKRTGITYTYCHRTITHLANLGLVVVCKRGRTSIVYLTKQGIVARDAVISLRDSLGCWYGGPINGDESPL